MKKGKFLNCLLIGLLLLPFGNTEILATKKATKSKKNSVKTTSVKKKTSVKISFVNANSAILINANTGKILFERNAYQQMQPASTTKVITALLALENSSMAKTVTISTEAASREGSSMHLASSERRSMEELVYGLMLVSGNDAATAIAKNIAGTEEKFACMMTAKARLLGLKNSQFKNASGLPAKGHYSTAYDMAMITKYALKNKIFAKIASTKSKAIPNHISGEVRYLRNHNKLLWRYPYTTGIKTGYTVSAGGCLIASAHKKNTTLIAVVFKTHTIYDDCQNLFEYGFGRIQ